jgi:hypothetical protein
MVAGHPGSGPAAGKTHKTPAKGNRGLRAPGGRRRRGQLSLKILEVGAIDGPPHDPILV